MKKTDEKNKDSLKISCRRFGRVSLLAAMAIVGGYMSSQAQTLYVPHVHVGGHAGAVLSQQSFNPSIEQAMHQGFMIGASFMWAEERHVGLRAELNLTQRGWTEKFDDTTQFSYSRTLTYVELPLMTHIFFGGRHVKCIFNLGPQLCYMIGDNISSNFDYHNPGNVDGFITANRTTAQMGMDVTNRFDYGITAGVGCEFTIGRKHAFTLEGRYYYGLGNIYPASKRDYFSASRGNAIMVTLGYDFRLK